ncbi:MAG TPA: ATP-binding protein [Terriglobales bacterium]|nr:ATP-binding protein [Terriglobales bacterium]
MRIRLKTKLVLAITLMVTAMVAALSSIYVSQIVHQRINADYQTGYLVASEVLQAAESALDVDLSNAPNPAKRRQQMEETLQSDAGLNTVMNSMVGNTPIIYDAAVVDPDGKILFSSNPNNFDKQAGKRDLFSTINSEHSWRQVRWIFDKSNLYTVYEIYVAPDRPDIAFGSVRVGISPVFLKNDLKPQIKRAAWFSLIAVVVSLVLAAGLSNLALHPLETISRRLDVLTAAHIGPAAAEPKRRTDEVGAVTSKIERIGREIRDVKEVFSALKENLDQIMGNLQDGLILFTRDLRAVLVSASAEPFLGKPRSEILGRQIDEIFTEQTVLGREMLRAVAAHEPIDGREVEAENRHRVHISLDFIEEHGERIGALVTMRDAESVHQIENEIELSRRLAAIGRLTSGVAHEVKNPINAIVVHLEILRQKLQSVEPDVQRHVDVIGNEIQRLDRVVQMLVDFTRPVELRLSEVDLRRLIEDVASLSAPAAERHNVELVREPPSEPILVKIDDDLVKQAILNVVLNGVQAMSEGGVLRLRAHRDDRGGVVVDIADNGPGIPPEIREKVFDLYFSTKKTGSGIGLAMTFRVMQLHNGSVDFDTDSSGTTFHLRFPVAVEPREIMNELATGTKASV